MNLSAALGGVMENVVKVVNLWQKANYCQYLDLSLSVKLQKSFIRETMNLRMMATKPVAQKEAPPLRAASDEQFGAHSRRPSAA